MSSFARFAKYPEYLANVIAFDPGGTTGYCVMGTYPDALENSGDLPLEQCLDHIDYGEIDCGSRHGQTGVGMERGHDGLNMPGEVDGIIRMINLAEEYPYSAIVFEDFILDMRKANSGRDLLTPVRIISGFVTLMSYSFGSDSLKRIFIQNRSLAKTTCTDVRLKHWGLYDGHSGPHARDAIRHAFYFLRSSRGNGNDFCVKRHSAWPYLFDDPHTVEKKPVSPKKQVGQRVWGLG